MDGVSIFRTTEGGQTKSKLWIERKRRERGSGREGYEEMINLHSIAASGQRRSSITGRRHSFIN